MREAAAARVPVPAILALCIAPLLFHLAIVETSHIRFSLTPSFSSLFKLGFVTAAALAHWAIYTSLLLTFGLTLRPGHEALITSMARKLHGEVPPELALYTRRVTIAWCCFFATQLTLSIMLFCFAPLVVWSGFVNILDMPLVITMFAAEYVCRLRCLKNPPKHSFKEIFNMVANSKTHGDQQVLSPDNVRPG